MSINNFDYRLFFHLFSMHISAIENGQVEYLEKEEIKKYIQKNSKKVDNSVINSVLYMLLSGSIMSAISYCDNAAYFVELSDKYFKKLQQSNNNSEHLQTISDLSNEIIHFYKNNKVNTKKDFIIYKTKFEIEKLNNMPSSLSIVAKNLSINPKYLARIFKEKTGETVGEYIAKNKMKVAKRRLIAEKTPIVKIGNDLGYDSYNTFFRSFKKYCNISPIDFRKKYGIINKQC